jgi:23S rRNA pseudouridine2605 synthase
MGYSVTKLLRVRIGELWLGDLEPGQWAVLTPPEVAMLMGEVSPGKRRSSPAPAGKGSAQKARTTGGPGMLPETSARHSRKPAPVSKRSGPPKPPKRAAKSPPLKISR